MRCSEYDLGVWPKPGKQVAPSMTTFLAGINRQRGEAGAAVRKWRPQADSQLSSGSVLVNRREEPNTYIQQHRPPQTPTRTRSDTKRTAAEPARRRNWRKIFWPKCLTKFPIKNLTRKFSSVLFQTIFTQSVFPVTISGSKIFFTL